MPSVVLVIIRLQTVVLNSAICAGGNALLDCLPGLLMGLSMAVRKSVLTPFASRRLVICHVFALVISTGLPALLMIK